VKIYTRGGDAGQTGLFGGDRVAKDDPRVQAYGAVDELNAALGLVIALDESGILERPALLALQEDMFAIGARLAAADPERALRKGTIPQLAVARITVLEGWIDELTEELPPLDAFILPGGTPLAAQLHVARTVCRRAERAIVPLADAQPDLADVVLPYMNRLSDLLFTLARAANHGAGVRETTWLPRRRGTGDESGGANE
jgi:cob(I)alamin adenosyltransferase